MNITEAEARKKWCPFGRAPWLSNTDAAAACNLTQAGDPMARCIASDCMAWRADNEYRHARKGRKPPRGFVIDGESDEELGEVVFVKRGGYCGLAGKP